MRFLICALGFLNYDHIVIENKKPEHDITPVNMGVSFLKMSIGWYLLIFLREQKRSGVAFLRATERLKSVTGAGVILGGTLMVGVYGSSLMSVETRLMALFTTIIC